MNLRKNNFRMLKIISVEFVRIDLRATQSIHSWNSHLKKKYIYMVSKEIPFTLLTFFYYSCLVQSLNIFSNVTFLIHLISRVMFSFFNGNKMIPRSVPGWTLCLHTEVSTAEKTKLLHHRKILLHPLIHKLVTHLKFSATQFVFEVIFWWLTDQRFARGTGFVGAEFLGLRRGRAGRKTTPTHL